MGKLKDFAKFIKAPRGTEDVLPHDWNLWRTIEKTAREVFELAGYYEIRTPIFEDTNLFVRSIGEVTDIVEKEMYTFNDGQASSITLRPENTASVMRAYVEYEMYKTKKFQKFYYFGPMFRKERPQAGRLRQFYQMGIEAIGATDPVLDTETIIVAMQMYNRLGLDDCRVKINSIGCKECRPGYREDLKERLLKNKNDLCGLCNLRLNRNVLRILDCKEETCKKIKNEMPSIHEHLCKGCRSSFDKLQESLTMVGINFVLEKHLVRGLDYYTKTVYEITHPSLGARDTICAGGRYDYLVSDIGGPQTGAVGFAAGVEATMLAIKNTIRKKNAAEGKRPNLIDSAEDTATPDVYIVSIDNECRNESFLIINKLRSSGISAEMDYEERSTKAQMRTANKIGAKNVVVIGPDEIKNRSIKLKNMKTGEEDEVEMAKIVEFLKMR